MFAHTSRRRHRTAVAIGALATAVLAACATDPASSPSASATATVEYVSFKNAIAADDADAVRSYLADGEDVQKDMGGGFSPLHVAAANGAENAASVLIETGADVEARGSGSGRTPLLSAAATGDGATVTVLLEAGADPLTPDRRGPSPAAMQYAGEHNNIDALQALLDYGVPIDQVEPSGGPAVIWGAYYGAEEATFFLLEQGADVNSVGSAGYGIAENAELGGYPELAERLREYLAASEG